MNGVFHLLIGSLGVAFATLILRANPRRWDNRAFATLGILDASMALFRGVAIASGVDIADRSVMWPCASMAPLLVWWSVEFAYSFPFSRPLPWRWRAPLVAATAISVVTMATQIDNVWATSAVQFGFFTPMLLVMVGLGWRNLHRHAGDRFGVRLLLVAILIRWVTANCLYSFYPWIDAELWSVLLWVESTVIVLLAFVLISFANIRSNLFTMRSAMGELAIESAFVMSGLLLTAAAVEGAIRLGRSWPHAERPLLMVASLMPLAVYWIAGRLRPRLEGTVDPRRAMRREVLERALRDDQIGNPEAHVVTAIGALKEISDGGDARFLPAGDFPAEVAATLAETAPGRVRVPIKHGGHVDGVLEVEGGIVDRETQQAATLLAARIGLAFEHRHLLGELEESRRLAALGSFAAAIAHDIRTPLTSVKMNMQILRGKASLPPDDMEYFDIAGDELERLEGHVKELLDYAKPLQLHRETIEVRDLTEDAARTLEPILAERGQRLWCEHEKNVPAVSCDPHRMKQVLWNLLENAAKASPAGAIIALHTRRDGPRVAIDVVDHGAGIQPRDLPRIFEPFFTTRPDGTGLGLAICQKVVKAHAGEIKVQSEPTAGSTFTVFLPA